MDRWRRCSALVLAAAIVAFWGAIPASAQDAPGVAVKVTRLGIIRIDGVFWNCISFENVSGRPVTAVEFSFAHVDAFGDVRGQVTGSRTGTFSPGVPIEGPTPNVITEKTKQNCWQEDLESYALAQVTVRVAAVTFAGGAQWTAPATAASPDAAVDVDYVAMGLPADQQRIALSRGRPCHVAMVESGAGSAEVWSYGCPSSNAPGARESYAFVNGRLVQHVVL